MNLYIFEPYEWAYCGGAIGIIAKTFKEAVKTIVEADKIRAAQVAKRSKLSVDDHRRYRSEYFCTNTETFEKDSSDQWLLTHKIPVSPGKLPEILFDNWNDA